jgi:hypothetical protein
MAVMPGSLNVNFRGTVLAFSLSQIMSKSPDARLRRHRDVRHQPARA